jgi:hypothetical protein
MKKIAPLREWPRRYPRLPLIISIIALISAIGMPLLRQFLASMT